MLTSSTWGRSAVTWLLQHRREMIVVSHVLLTLLASYLAFALRFEGAVPERYSVAFQQGLPWLLVLRLAAFCRLHLFEGLWRYTGVWDLRNIIVAVGLSSAAFFVFTSWIVPLPDYPHSVYFIDAVLLTLFLGGLRLAGRLYRELAGRTGAKWSFQTG